MMHKFAFYHLFSILSLLARVVEWVSVIICSGGGMVDTYVSDAYALWVCGFKSHLEHHI
jgi:hypothetical protein